MSRHELPPVGWRPRASSDPATRRRPVEAGMLKCSSCSPSWTRTAAGRWTSMRSGSWCAAYAHPAANGAPRAAHAARTPSFVQHIVSCVPGCGNIASSTPLSECYCHVCLRAVPLRVLTGCCGFFSFRSRTSVTSSATSSSARHFERSTRTLQAKSTTTSFISGGRRGP